MNVSILELLTQHLGVTLEAAPKSQGAGNAAPPGLFAEILANLTSEELSGVLEAAEEAADASGQPALLLPDGQVVLQDALANPPALALVIQPESLEGKGDASNTELESGFVDEVKPAPSGEPKTGVSAQEAAAAAKADAQAAAIVVAKEAAAKEAAASVNGTAKSSTGTSVSPDTAQPVKESTSAVEAKAAASAAPQSTGSTPVEPADSTVQAKAPAPERGTAPAEPKPVVGTPAAPVDSGEERVTNARPATSDGPRETVAVNVRTTREGQPALKSSEPTAPVADTPPVKAASSQEPSAPEASAAARAVNGASPVDPSKSPQSGTPKTPPAPVAAANGEAVGQRTVAVSETAETDADSEATVRTARADVPRTTAERVPVQPRVDAPAVTAPTETGGATKPAAPPTAEPTEDVKPTPDRVSLLRDKPVRIDGQVRFVERPQAERVPATQERVPPVASDSDGPPPAKVEPSPADEARIRAAAAARTGEAPVDDVETVEAAKSAESTSRVAARAFAESPEYRVPVTQDAAATQRRDAVEAHSVARQPVDAVQSATPGQAQSGLGSDTASAHRAAPTAPPADLVAAQMARPTLETVGEYAVKSVRFLASSNESTMSVRLVPESLGRLDLVVKSTPSGVEIHVASASQAVRDSLELHVHTMREALARDGIEVTRVTVSPTVSADTPASTLANSAFAGRQSNPWQSAPQAGSHGGHGPTRHDQTYPGRDYTPARNHPVHDGSLNVFA